MRRGSGLIDNTYDAVMQRTRDKIELLDDVILLRCYLSGMCDAKVRRFKLLVMGLFDMQMSTQSYKFISMQSTVSNQWNVLANLSRNIMRIRNLHFTAHVFFFLFVFF